MAFLSANYILNILTIALKQKGLFTELVNSLPLNELLTNALSPDKLGSASLSFQIQRISSIYKEFYLPIELPLKPIKPEGIRGRYIATTGINPSIYNAWL
jgi:hypothetical protein